jgi:hypothetical protein
MKKDYLIVILAYFIMCITIEIILPINTQWYLVCFLLIGMGIVLQRYWDKRTSVYSRWRIEKKKIYF